MNTPELKLPPPLDPGFVSAALFNRQYRDRVRSAAGRVPLLLGIEREHGLVARWETEVDPSDPATFLYVERLLKFLLWARGGWKVYFAGPADLGRRLQRMYSPRGERRFDCEIMERAYGRRFQFVLTTAGKVPPNREMRLAAGGHLRGCRIGFDLGASDYKVSAVRDGEAVFTEETPWDPKNQPDPSYHYHHLSAGLHRAAAHLPRVDAIGGSSAGIIVDNEIRVASLLRAVPRRQFARAAGLFKRIQKEWGVPLVVMNDGDVTALAGALSLGVKGVLGIAMGSSQAGGYLDRKGRILGWLNELAFAPVDYNPSAPADEWSGDRGVGALYFSQQAVNKLLPAAGVELPAEMGLPERLLKVQERMARGDERARKIYETIGVYLGHAIAHYADFYDFGHLLVLGRVTTGAGCDVIIAQAREVLAAEFPDLAGAVAIHVPDEKSRRVGQAVAAASLPPARRR